MTKIMVAGGAGFLGSHLCEKLLNSGAEVICVDNLITGSRENIKSLEPSPNFKFLELDITQPLPKDLEVDQIYHLASPASPHPDNPKSYHSLWRETMDANTVGTMNLVEFCLKNNAQILYVSTSEVYGDPLVHPQSEDYRGNVSPTGPRAVYDEAKRYGETIVSAFVRKKNLNGRIVRVFNTYGPKMALDDGRVVIEFLQAAKEGKPIPIFGDGTQTRSFMFVSDLVEGLVAMMETEQAKGEVINLGNPDEYTILELANVIKKITNSDSELQFKTPLPEDDPLKRRPDITKAKKMLGWEPQVSLEEGLRKFNEYLD